MSPSSNEKSVNKEVEKAFAGSMEKVNEYIRSLKRISSEEVLNGSIEEAQKILNKIIPIETASKKLIAAQDEFVKAMNTFDIKISGNQKEENSSPKEPAVHEGKDKSQKPEKNDQKSPKDKFRISILKALIYLGGSARIDEVMDFIERDMRNKFLPGDHEVTNGDQKYWQVTVKDERDSMTTEGLLSAESSNGTWEIVQKGIDYLSRHGK